MRRYGDPPQPGRAYQDRVGAYAVIRDGGDLLVTHYDPDREFQLPGGGMDPGEGMLRALHRECLEETGWRIRVERRLGAFQRFTYAADLDAWLRKVCHVYLARPVLQLGPPADSGHHAIWMPMATAVVLLANDGDRAFVRRVAATAPR
jgi:8-oxo-dGTP diphosphatase